MTTWSEFTKAAPRIAEVFVRRHTATGNLCMLATLRSDGFPRISPMEPRMFEEHLVVGGMPNTTKFADLHRDPRFTLHTATVDTHVSDGDAKIWGTVVDVPDPALHRRFTDVLYETTGFDLRGREFPYFYVADILGGSAVEIADGGLTITVWKRGEDERVIRKD
ncbi:pyridoxamine 5'-phosphate oxidase family protein [Pseudonocardia sp. TRM90224]|uniref:pyridoxamine 5'-phosphate oxidase family protein n=1 Tax=Pseudonocardia sp. TRM90224 TaxID=2812678 RepID=UPI001E30A26D|nr:pyridoxamine 5'-phosphate oxidase family protein [Pseudonocardia sp. TRM90224]